MTSCVKFQVEGVVKEKIDKTIENYRDNVDLQSFIDGVQQNVRSFVTYITHLKKMKICCHVVHV